MIFLSSKKEAYRMTHILKFVNVAALGCPVVPDVKNIASGVSPSNCD
jgi:hypothetical protein